MLVGPAKPASLIFLSGEIDMADYTMNSKDFFTALSNETLIGSRCIDCASFTIPQRKICPKCHSLHTEIIKYSGSGKLVAFTVIFVPPVMMAQAGYDGKNPYCVGIVELDEGPRISAQILDVDIQRPENIKIGTKMQMTTITRNEGYIEKSFLAFRPT